MSTLRWHDLTDQAICDTGCLPFLVSLTVTCAATPASPRAVHAVMHMARDSRDAKRQLTEEGVVAKMRDIVEAYDPESADSESLVVLRLLPGESRGGHRVLGQAELKAERDGPGAPRLERRRSVEVRAGVRCVLARVRQEQSRQRLRSHGERRATCVGVPPPARPRGGEKGRPTRLQRGAGHAGRRRRRDERGETPLCGELLLRECLGAWRGPKALRADTLGHAAPGEGEGDNARSRAPRERRGRRGSRAAADGARLPEEETREEIFDAEAALEKKLVQQLAAREKELAEAEAARVELPKAQARVGHAVNAVKKK